MTNNIEIFLTNVMTNYEREENTLMVKYYNKNYELLIQKKKDGRLSDSCVVIDKRKQPIIYNDINVALQKLN